jgi:ESCRT-II complex subunit VPS22
MWTDVLGIGDFYYDLGLRIIRQCIKTRAVNGGIMKVDDIVHRINASTAKGGAVVSCDDVKRAVLKLSVLDKCFRVIDLGEPYVMSVPLELSMDHQAIIAVASSYSYACFSLLEAMHGWTTERFDTAISFLLQEEVVWVDDNNGSEKRYMMPSSSLG